MDTVNEVIVNHALGHNQLLLAHENEEMKEYRNVVDNVRRLKRKKT